MKKKIRITKYVSMTDNNIKSLSHNLNNYYLDRISEVGISQVIREMKRK